MWRSLPHTHSPPILSFFCLPFFQLYALLTGGRTLRNRLLFSYECIEVHAGEECNGVEWPPTVELGTNFGIETPSRTYFL